LELRNLLIGDKIQSNMGKESRVGIIGTGFIARGLSYSLQSDESLGVSRILTRRNYEEVRDMAVEKRQITNSIQELVDTSDIVVECSGDPIHATDALIKVLEAGIPVVTMDSELQVTTGSWLQKRGLFTEAEGDQPGSLAALQKDVLGMGFEPIVYGNIKGFLNHTPTVDEMRYWGNRSGISLDQVTSFTDGTKIQIEQTLVANGLGVNAAKHDREQSPFLRYYKLGDGPYYVLTRPFHLCHLEITKTIRQVLQGEGVLLNNGDNPQVSVATIAKRRLVPGELLKRGVGGFSVRGEALNISGNETHVPIGLVFDVVMKRYVEPGQIITFDDIEIPESKALVAWQETIRQR